MKFADLKLKTIETSDPNGSFEAVLSTPVLDRDGEIVAAGAFSPLPSTISIYVEHDFLNKELPVGIGQPYYDGNLLKIRGTFGSSTKAQEVRRAVDEGLLHSMSAGFRSTKKRGNTIVDADLIEASFTGVPVNKEALVMNTKGFGRRGRSLRESRDDIVAALQLAGPAPRQPVTVSTGQTHVSGWGFSPRGSTEPVRARTEIVPPESQYLRRGERQHHPMLPVPIAGEQEDPDANIVSPDQITPMRGFAAA